MVGEGVTLASILSHSYGGFYHSITSALVFRKFLPFYSFFLFPSLFISDFRSVSLVYREAQDNGARRRREFESILGVKAGEKYNTTGYHGGPTS